MKFIHVLSVVSTLVLAAACGSDSSTPAATGGTSNSNNNNNNTPTPSDVAEEVTAAEGGEVALDDGAGVNIPAGALSDDTEISIESSEPSADLPELDSVQGLAYEFGPDGTTFEVPVELTLPLVGAPGADQEAVVSWLNTDTNQWEDLDTTATRDAVIAETTHFTLFVVRFKDVAVDAFTCDFDDTCTGGNIVGEWTIQGACIDFANPFEDFCADATFQADTEFVGSITFNDDGTYSSSITTGGTLHLVLPASCLTQLTGGQTVACTELGLFDSDEDGGGGGTCTGDSATGCDCTGPIEDEANTDSGTYTTDGNSVTTVDQDQDTDTSTYCVSGDTLKVKSIEDKGDGGDSNTIVWTGVR
jgi:hypothetical protein